MYATSNQRLADALGSDVEDSLGVEAGCVRETGGYGPHDLTWECCNDPGMQESLQRDLALFERFSPLEGVIPIAFRGVPSGPRS